MIVTKQMIADEMHLELIGTMRKKIVENRKRWHLRGWNDVVCTPQREGLEKALSDGVPNIPYFAQWVLWHAAKLGVALLGLLSESPLSSENAKFKLTASDVFQMMKWGLAISNLVARLEAKVEQDKKAGFMKALNGSSVNAPPVAGHELESTFCECCKKGQIMIANYVKEERDVLKLQ